MDRKIEASVNRVIQRIYLQEKISNEAKLYLIDKKSTDYSEINKEKLWIKRIEIIKNEYILGMIPKSQYYFHITYVVENIILSNKMLSGEFDKYLEPISKKIRKIEKDHGLSDNEYWKRKDGPKEWQDLNKQYENQLNELYAKLLLDFECNDIYDTYENHKKEYKRLVEKGRLEIFEKSKKPLLPEILKAYKAEFEKCKKMKLFYSAIIMAGATLETYLMIICDKNINKLTSLIIEYNSCHKKKLSKNPADWDLSHLLQLCEKAELFPFLKINNDIVISITDIGEIIRQARNLVHPGRHLKSSEHIIEENNFKDIEAYYYIFEYAFNSLEKMV